MKYFWENNFLLSFFLTILMFIFLFIYLSIMKKTSNFFLKKMSFECGIDSWGLNENFFSMRFFLVGMIFLIFDIEIIILFPFFFNMKIIFFLLVVCLIVMSLVYEWTNNSLVWK